MGKSMKTWYDWIMTSSVNPEKLSLTIRSTVALIVSAVLYFGIDLGDTDEITKSLVNLVTGVSLVISSLSFVYGAIRKIANAIKNKFK